MINVLRSALRLIPKQHITYKKFVRVSSNNLGNQINVYEDPITVIGSIQPADNDTLYKLGIANTGDYFICYIHGNALSIAQLQSNDVIIGSDGQVYNIFQSEMWYNYPDQDWNKIIIRRAKNYGHK